MSKSEKYWVFAICWLFLGQRDPSHDETWQLILSFFAYAVAVGYFVAMFIAAYREVRK